jgi:hypothetical protein
MPEIIQCPSCQRELQVPEDFIGRPVKCPSCGANFVTSAPSSGGSAPPPRVEPASYAPAGPVPGAYGSMTPAGTPGMVLAPAICLLIFGILCFLVDIFEVVRAMNPKMLPGGDGLPPMLQQILEEQQKNVTANIIRSTVFIIASFVILLGAAQMMRMRTWGLALAGSIVAMLHFQECCCLLGLPLGVWSVVILCRADVRSLFQ